MTITRTRFVVAAGLVLGLLATSFGVSARAADPLQLQARERRPHPTEAGRSVVKHRDIEWQPDATALIVIDMWDDHWCRGAAGRVVELAPHANRFVAAARSQGVLVIHAPSGCMGPYEEHPGRARALAAPRAATLPEGIAVWCRSIPAEEGLYPIDQEDGGCDCSPHCPTSNPWKRQIESIEIDDRDAISDSGEEIWNLLEAEGIENVMILGVHTNMCVLGRPFGLRNLDRFGKNVVLARDLTDTMYNHESRPFVSHHQGTELIVEHIEACVCPTILSTSLTGEPAFAFSDDERPRALVMIGEHEYQTDRTLPAFAAEELEPQGIACDIVQVDSADPNNFPGLERLERADLLFLSVRRRTPPREQLELVRRHLAAGKPLVGIRTASHAFDAELPDDAHASWGDFDLKVLGVDYQGHYSNDSQESPTMIRPLTDAASHPILNGVDAAEFPSGGTLYKNRDLSPSATLLLSGRIQGEQVEEPVAWTTTYEGGRVFYTSLGQIDDFAQPSFRRVLTNAVFWALDAPLPNGAVGD